MSQRLTAQQAAEPRESDRNSFTRSSATRNRSLPRNPGLERPGYIHNAANAATGVSTRRQEFLQNVQTRAVSQRLTALQAAEPQKKCPNSRGEPLTRRTAGPGASAVPSESMLDVVEDSNVKHALACSLKERIVPVAHPYRGIALKRPLIRPHEYIQQQLNPSSLAQCRKMNEQDC